MAGPITSLFVANGQYTLRDGDAPPLGVAALRALKAGNTLVATADGSALFLAGTRTGWIDMSVDLADHEPPLDLSAVEAAVDVSYYSPTGRSYLVDLEGDRHDAAGNLAHAGPGWYRLRVTATGREKANLAALLPDEEERHTIQIWPAPPAEETVHKRDRLVP